MDEEKFLGCKLGLEIPPRTIFHEIICPNVYAGSVVTTQHFASFAPFVFRARGYNGGLQVLTYFEVSGPALFTCKALEIKTHKRSQVSDSRAFATIGV